MVFTPKHHYHSRATAFNLSQVNLLCLILIAAISIIYLLEINFMVSGGWQLRVLGKHLDESRKEVKQLELETVELQSMQRLSERSSALGLVSLNRANYVSAQPSVVALK